MEHALKKMHLFIWDFDGTLMDTYPVTFAAYLHQALADFGYSAPAAEVMEKMLVNTGHAVSYYMERYDLPQLRERYKYYQAKGAVAMPETLPQVKEVLQRVRELGGVNCIYTHRDATIFPMLEHGQLTELFEEIIIPGSNAFATKPAPDTILYLMEKYGIELKFVNYADEDKLKIKLLAGDNDFDIFRSEGYHLRLDYPMYEPLDGYDCITEQFDLMYDEIRQICTHDGHIFGVAIRIDVNNNVMQCNDALFEELGLEIPEYGWTYEDFYELKVKAAEYGVDDYPYAIFWPAHYIHKYGDLYETKSLTDDGSALREILALMKQPIERNVEVDTSRVLFPGDADDRFWFPNSTKHYIVQPSFDGEPCIMTMADFLQMNIQSQNKENAALVMAEFMKMEYNPMGTVGIVFFKEMGDEIRQKGDVASANVDLYLRMLNDYKPYYLNQELLDFANDHYAKYMNDEQDLEYTADQIYARAKLFFEE